MTKWRTNRSKKKQNSFSLCSREASCIAFCSKQQQRARRRRHLNNPACFCPSRPKAHCPDGNENIFEMKRTFFPEPRAEFLLRLFISAISAPLRAHSPSQAFIFTRRPFSTFLFLFFFIEDEEGLQLHNWPRRWLSIGGKNTLPMRNILNIPQNITVTSLTSCDL